MTNSAMPDNWSKVALEELLVFVLGGDWGKDEHFYDPDYVDVLCIRASELKNWDSERGETAAKRKVKRSSLEKRELFEGDILVEISGGGPEQPVGRTVLIDRSVLSKNASTKKICTNFFRLARPSNHICSKYLNHYLQHFYKAGNISDYQAGSNNLRNLKFNDYVQVGVPIPPLNEQKRIVAKIEELFSELDNGIAALKTAREQLKVYRQAVLKHAFEGKLTAQWREENADKLESPEQLLARIQQEREARYQQQLEDWKAAVKEWEANGKEGKKPGKPKKLEPQGDPDGNYSLKLELPDIWSPCCIGQAYSVYVGATPSRKEATYWNGDIFWVSSGEVSFCEITDTAEKITEAGYENTSTEIHPPGTVLLAMIGEGKTRGQAAITRVPAAHNQNTAAIRVSEAKLSPEYLYHFLQYQYEQTRRVGSGNNQKALNKARVSSIEFPLCSNAEQLEVVALLSEKLSVVENIEREIDDSLARSETLRQSILKKSFSGQLVPQDPSDEPASELLARIQSEKEAEKAKNAKPKSSKKRASKSKAKESV